MVLHKGEKFIMHPLTAELDMLVGERFNYERDGTRYLCRVDSREIRGAQVICKAIVLRVIENRKGEHNASEGS